MYSTYGRLGGRPLAVLRCSRRTAWDTCKSSKTKFLSANSAGLQHATRRTFSDNKLDLPSLDEKWRSRWAANPGSRQGDADGCKGRQYILPMFPYPSGNLHLGHLRVYTIADVLARFHQLTGHDVLLPMGWDAFGLPAENAAIERGVNPADWTKANIANMKVQLQLMNGSWDWSHELATSDPEFYKHTQRIFLLLHDMGLAYQAEAEVNYDPVDKTVLANEQVDANGRSWRSGAQVEKRHLKQWFLRISEYRESLLQDLEVLSQADAWPERVLAMQKNWLGKSTGAMVKFPVMAFQHVMENSAIEVFTTRPDTLFGVQYLALASTHPVVADLATKDPELQAFLDTLPGLPPDSKVGYMLPHLRAVNPLAYHGDTPDATKASLPVYVAPYVLGDYGEGAVMGVPGHDLRDHAFWKEHHYDQPIRVVLAASDDESTTAMMNEPFIEHGYLTEHAGSFKGKTSEEAGKELITLLETAELAKPVEKWRLRDWLVSRQRYWGAPIPIIHCDACGAVPVPQHQLPVLLPAVDSHFAQRKTGNPLETAHDWVNTSCPKCNGAAKRDTDTMDTFVDSSWYYMRFIDPHNSEAPFSAEKAKSMLPVDLYIGGIEHAILHLLYARFVYKALMASSLVHGEDGLMSGISEPFRRLITQGMVHGKTYIDPTNGRFLKPDELDISDASNPKILSTGGPAEVAYEKMSKSKHNGIDPTQFIAKYGADATRAHMLFQAPVGEVLNWDETKISGVTRWFDRIHEMVQQAKVFPRADTTAAHLLSKQSERVAAMTPAQLAEWDADSELWRGVQTTIASVTESYGKVYQLNTVVSDLMSLTNTIAASSAARVLRKQALSSLLRMLAPIAPAFAEECWSVLNPSSPSIFQSGSFPCTDGTLAMLQPRLRTCVIQLNGKMRYAVEIPQKSGLVGDELKDWLVAEILKTPEGKAKLGSEPMDITRAKRAIIVDDGKLVNFVL